MRTVCLTISYYGTAYCGWQWQPNGVSVQQVVESALAEFTGETIRVTAAGRTDAGVHALGQLVSFHTTSGIPAEGFRYGLQTQLPDDIVIRDAVERPYGYSARFDAVRKRYRYVIHNTRTPLPWLRNLVWWHRGPLDLAAMQAAAAVLLGTHDFRCFESKWPNKSSSVRTIFEARWQSCDSWQPWAEGDTASIDLSMEGQESNNTVSQFDPSTWPDAMATEHSGSQPFLCFDIVADGFLYNMVRAIVGTLVHVGRGRWTAADVKRILDIGDRADAGDTAPAHGLSLIHVDAPVNRDRIAARLERWRQRQTAADEDDAGDSAE